MPDLITLTCPTCGAKLKVTDQIHLLACRNCGNEHMVIRNVDAIYLAPMAQDVRGIRVGVDKTAAELAVARLTKEVAELDSEYRKVLPYTLNQWKPPSSDERNSIKIAVVAFLFFVGGLGNQLPGLAIISIAICIVMAIIYFRTSTQRTRAARSLRDSELPRLEQSLSKKSSELKKNRAIAES
jgi:hypothetical protein